MVSLSLAVSPTLYMLKLKNVRSVRPTTAFTNRTRTGRNCSVRASLFNPADDPVVKEALKEPIAFLGGMFAGLLRLDLNEDPLREWVTRTVEASGLTLEDTESNNASTTDDDDESPQQIEIE